MAECHINGRGFDSDEVTCVSTVTLDHELYRRATEAAAAQGKTVDEFVDEALRKALSKVGVRRTVRNGLPVMVVSDDTPPIDPAKVRRCLGRGGVLIALPDINVLLALAWSNHPYHDAAHRWFTRDATAGWATCLLTQTGFLRLSLNPQVVGVSIDCQAAVHLLRNLVAHPYQYRETAPALTTPLFIELVPRIIGYRQVSDATLLYLARVGGLKLVTFDRPVAAVCPWPEHLELLTP
jgi:toxin-antitoxin system PIN domain toxin